ncbi:uncharacterized protein LOC129610892, partial [Condylostylus longicornis]|uniref:uncharacterized protein LOC129610892 n=1 Tax=Condylostylus longicornis TaxID=2530218 RepID=UPI00244DD044
LKRTIIKNPTIIPQQCTYHFQSYNSNVCQLRIDFDMTLAQPTIPDGNNGLESVTCLMDKFSVGNTVICGTNTKQHRMLSYFTQQYTNLPDLRTLFLRPNYYADVDLLAPPGCLQYFTKRQGTFESFNFNMGKGPYMSNMRYGICFKRTPLDHKIRFSSETFQIGAASDTSNFVDIDCHDIVATPKRSNDYLTIPESVLESDIEMFGNYYCGTSLRDDITYAPPGPFVIYFNSDNLFSTLVPEVGFKINYVIQ